MHRQTFRLLPLLFIALLALAGCAGKGSSGGSSPLVQGLKQNSASPQVASEGDAKVISVKPGVVSIYEGRAEQLQPGMAIPGGAILRSDDTGTAQLSFNDGTTLDISPNSEIALADVAPATSAKKPETAGRSMTRKFGGKFGRGDTGASSQATIGIRGLK